MSILEGFLLKILRSDPISKEDAGQMNIIVRRPYDYLETELLKVFKGQKDIKVKVDRRRYGRIRTKQEPFSYERHQAEKRRQKETLIEVVIST